MLLLRRATRSFLVLGRRIVELTIGPPSLRLVAPRFPLDPVAIVGQLFLRRSSPELAGQRFHFVDRVAHGLARGRRFFLLLRAEYLASDALQLGRDLGHLLFPRFGRGAALLVGGLITRRLGLLVTRWLSGLVA